MTYCTIEVNNIFDTENSYYYHLASPVLKKDILNLFEIFMVEIIFIIMDLFTFFDI